MPIPINTTISSIMNATSKILPTMTNIENIPSFIVLIIFVFLLIILLRVGILAMDTIIELFKRFALPIIIFGLAYVMAIFYYLPVYVPDNFVKPVFNETLNMTVNVTDEHVYNDLKHYTNLIFIPAFYDKLMYYQVKYEKPFEDVVVPFSIQFLMFIYIANFVLWRYIGIYSIPLTMIIFFIITFGGKGFIHVVLTYPILLLVLSIYVAIMGLIILFKITTKIT